MKVIEFVPVANKSCTIMVRNAMNISKNCEFRMFAMDVNTIELNPPHLFPSGWKAQINSPFQP